MARRTFLATGAASAAVRVARGARPDPLVRLRGALGGRLVAAGDADYDTLRRPSALNPQTDKRPLAIARCQNADDVRRSIEAARNAGLDFAVRAGGHDVLGACVCEGGLVIDLRPMASVAIDAARQRARIGAGVISGDANRAAGAYGLAPVLGCNPSVGVAGLTLGGGLGWLIGTHGAACDHLDAAEVVTADGVLLRAGPNSHSELLWALRGGGGNFGVVTALDLNLAPLVDVLGGALVFSIAAPGSLAAFLTRYSEFMAEAPIPLTVELAAFELGDAPVMVALVCWSGAPDEGARVVEQLRLFGRPIIDQVRSVQFAHLTDQPGAPAPPPYLFWRGASLDSLTNPVADELEAQIRAAPPGWSLGLGHVMRGAVTRGESGAFVRRPGQAAYFIGSGWGDPALGEARMAWVESAMAAMSPWSSAHGYVNYLSSDAPADVAAAYGPNFARLRAVKQRYDPENLFRHNRNIPPATKA